MNLSVIIVSYNAVEYLGPCLASVRARLAGVEHEVCVVENDSDDRSRELIEQRFPEVKVVVNRENLGFSAAMNIGLAHTSGRYVLWLNPDAKLLNDGAAELLRFLDGAPGVGVVGPQLINSDGSVQLSCRSFPSYEAALFNRYSLLTRWLPRNRYSRKYLFTDWDHASVREVDWVSGACLLHRREVLGRVGGLDERFFMYMEDIDFCLRAKQAGWEVCYHPALQALHHIAGSTRQVPMLMLYELHRSIWHYYAKHFPRNPLKDALAAAVIWSRYAFLTLQTALTGQRSRRQHLAHARKPRASEPQSGE